MAKQEQIIIKKGTGKNVLSFSVPKDRYEKNKVHYDKDGYTAFYPEQKEKEPKEVKDQKKNKSDVVEEIQPETTQETKQDGE